MRTDEWEFTIISQLENTFNWLATLIELQFPVKLGNNQTSQDNQ